jgi:GntP family gluconate:H+ symporter
MTADAATPPSAALAAPASKAPAIALAVGALAVIAGTIGGQSVRGNAVTYWPFVVLAVSVALVITLITVVRLHAFVALVLSAMAAGFMAVPGTLGAATSGIVRSTQFKPVWGHFERAVEGTAIGLGETAGAISIIIALASIIGLCMLQSGAADRIVRWFLGMFGEQRAGLALLVSTYVVSIPIFFDTLFMLLVPIARALFLRTGRDYMLYVMAICTAGIITHSMVIPHPGPLAMAASLDINIALSVAMGLGSGVFPLIAGWFLVQGINRRVGPEVKITVDPVEAAAANRPLSELPPLWLSLCPVILPVILMSVASTAAVFRQDVPRLYEALAFAGNRNVSLLIGAAFGLYLLMRQSGWTLREIGDRVSGPLEVAGIIILITAAGGAFGFMLRAAGVGDAIKTAVAGVNVSYILLAYAVALVIRIAQGSATVAMLTTAGMLADLMKGGDLGYHPVYIFLAIGYGAFGVSWMNDSGFWVVSRLGGMTERQTLRSWTLMSTVVSVAGLLTTLAMAALMPLKGQ